MANLCFNNTTWRLGNQMFQYAATLGISQKTGHDPWYNVDKTYLKDCFELGSVNSGLNESVEVACVEPDFTFNENFFLVDNTRNIDLQGYFQSEKYFTHCEDVLRKDFTFKKDVRDAAVKKLMEAGETKKVSIHIRRTDYLNLAHVHTTLGLDYFESALKYFPNHKPVVFSDDIEWCKQNMSHFEAYFSEENDHFIDLCMMSLCDGHIIANSSFSWWGAWIGQGKTVAPKKWFGSEGPKNWSDVYCKDWIIHD
ncbi:alpha-1,2-fucosyltransferase [Hyphomonas sp.]|uniref:alpha-1,2-fucosyltransferase n=1 Tax=Hyphomonas sp. TaxID=87 RepID=UPI000C8EF3E8|nr:alpha-1,2-fucosyltransferase [Hyphomonas sp.]MAL45726.1 alpha-1,2-fucosyltransferase [Hyphomonas sp.]|tara:strand:+ start:543 stop:1301 length:759 start_codon:yes stop_codon:yes gene_type:complete